MNQIIEQLPGYHFWKDTESTYIGANKNFREFAGIRRNSVEGLTDYDLPWDNTADEYIAQDREAIAGKNVHRIELVPTQNKTHMGIIQKAPIYENNKIIGVTCSFTPIHELEKAFVKLTPSIRKDLFFGISKQESRILNWVLKGLSMRQIGEKFFISPRTIESHIENMKAKFNVSTKSELITKAVSIGFLYCLRE